MNADTVKMTRKDVWKAIKKHPSKVLNWLGINIGIGLMTLWIAILFYWFSQLVSSPSEKVIKGHLIVFVTTLCASSMSIFSEIKDDHFKGMRDTLIWIVVIFIVLAASVGAFVSAPSDVKTFGIDPDKVFWISFPIAGIGILLSFLLYAMRLTLETANYADDLKETIAEETEEAKIQIATSDGNKV